MTMKNILLTGTVLFVAGITLLQVFVNQEGRLFPERGARAQFRVGFLPVT